MKTYFCSLAASVTLFVVSVCSQQTANPNVKQINTLAQAIERATNRQKEPDLVFADTGEFDENKPNWQRFRSTTELDKSREEKESYSVAYTWRSKGKLTASNFTFFSPSGDWTQYVEHYFRSDGTTALVKAELRTFMDDCVIKQKYYLDKRGKRIRSTVNYFDLTTNKPKRRCLGSDALKFDYYKSVEKLPFAKLLKQKNSH
ncbi:MAG: hypothetical protein ABI878_03300 [Acidobacteriota bacterium]